MSELINVMYMAEALQSVLVGSDYDPWVPIMEEPTVDLFMARFQASQYSKTYTCKTRVIKITCELVEEFNGMH